LNILYAVSEATPFIKTGGLADVAGSLPKALCAEGEDARVILPLYGAISDEWRSQLSLCFETVVHLAWREQYCGVYSLRLEGVVYYFVDNEYYFKRDKIYGCYDDGERFSFFSKAIIEILPKLGWKPDVINCNDWQTALIPIYLRLEAWDFYVGIKTVFTIHNIEYQGRFGKDTSNDVFGLPTELYTSGIIRYENDINLMKGAIYKSDFVTTVSPSYANELRDPYFACGLHMVVADNAYKLKGIVNGIDVEHFNPKTDSLIAKKYGPASMSGKKVCKADLCREIGFDENDESPIIACVSRLVGHKGFDLVAEALDAIVSKNARLIILGTGNSYFENYFREAEYRHKGRVSANIMYSDSRASKIYSGADMLLMPSKSEPCGLSQLIAMRYGTVPIVHEVGGLKDTVHPYPSEDSNGFSFYGYSVNDILRTIDYAINTWSIQDEWKSLMRRGMTEDLSWNRSAKEYINIYASLFEQL
jgi:starch synthase